MNDVTLEVEDLSKTYEGHGHLVHAIRNVSFKLYRGEFVVIMGTSGSGKSTLLNILSALDKPTSGVFKLNGEAQHHIFEEPAASIYRQKNIGFIFQSYHLLKDLSAEDNIAVPLILQGESESNIRARLDQTIELLGLSQWRRHRPVQLSGGQQQRVAIGRAIISNPPILLADEPTGNLDYNTSKEILDVLIRMREQLQQSVLLVTHDPAVATCADRVLFFHDGQIVHEYQCKGEQDLESILSIFQMITEGSDRP